MTNTDLVEFKTIYPDIERYLAEDCYVPNEVRDSRTGISCIQVPANTMVAEIVKTDKMAEKHYDVWLKWQSVDTAN